MDKLKTTNVGGFPLVLNDLRWFFGRLGAPSEGIYQAFNNLLRGFGGNFIIQGCVEGGTPGAVTLTEGWIILGGELLKVEAQAAFDEATDNTFIKVTTFDSRGNKEFQNASIDDTYEKNRGNISGSGGTLDYNGNRMGIASVVEAAAGTDNMKIITPLTLATTAVFASNILRGSTEALNNASFSTSETSLHSIKPSATKGSINMHFVYQGTLAQAEAFDINTTIRLKVGGVIKHNLLHTIKAGDVQSVCLQWMGTYAANEIIEVFGITPSGTVGVSSSILLFEAVNAV